jgi:membrane-associated phospholipid phosphatase
MTREDYESITGRLRGDKERIAKVRGINNILTGFVFAVYPLYILMLFVREDPFLARAVIVPAVSFAAVTVFRRIYNAKRPYEKFGIPPVIEKATVGKSFPSRHVFSVFIIAVTIFYSHPGPGIILGIVGCLLGAIRVVGGVHEPRDVIAGAIIGIAAGVAGYYVI